MDLEQLDLKKMDYGQTILIVSVAIGALLFVIGFLDGIGGISAPWNG